MAGEAKRIAATELEELFDELKTWGRWGNEDQKGSLNLITPAKLQAARGLIRDGVTVSASLPLAKRAGPYNTNPVLHHMLRAGDLASPAGYSGALDFFAMAAHGMSDTHLDALCHIFFNGKMYNGINASEVTSAGARFNAIDNTREGIVSRGVLLDIPALRGLPYLEPGEAIYADELKAAEERQGMRVESGDILLVYTGRHRRVAEKGAWNPRELLAGLHGTSMRWLHERGVAVLGCDGISDVIPAGLEGVPTPQAGRPVHILALPAMGVHLIDNCDLEALATACSERKRWEFLLTVAPLYLTGGTGCPVNPIAVF
jgi:kynurenine formamidase